MERTKEAKGIGPGCHDRAAVCFQIREVLLWRDNGPPIVVSGAFACGTASTHWFSRLPSLPWQSVRLAELTK